MFASTLSVAKIKIFVWYSDLKPGHRDTDDKDQFIYSLQISKDSYVNTVHAYFEIRNILHTMWEPSEFTIDENLPLYPIN